MSNNSVQIKIMQNKEEWESFLLSQDLPPFLQSWNAAEQAESMGEKTLRLGIFKDEELAGICLIHEVRARRGSYLYTPYGPVFQQGREDLLYPLITFLKEYAKKEQFWFIRITPYWERNDRHQTLLKHAGFITAPIHMLSEIVWKLDITPDEEILLKNMRKTTRNLIRRAEKDGVVIRKSKDPKDVDTFIQLMDKTHKRHSFVPYPDDLYKKQLEYFEKDDQVVVFSGEHGTNKIASAIVMYYGNVASYHHGASIRSKVPVAYRLQWEAILEAKKRGCREYSFWGIEESEDPKHPFYGITKFKKGFGGEKRYLVMAQDLPVSSFYWLTWCIESFRRVKRGFGLIRH